MTWYYDVNNSNDEMDVYDNNKNKITTVKSDGFRRIQDTKKVMSSEASKERSNNGISDRYLSIMEDINLENIKEY